MSNFADKVSRERIRTAELYAGAALLDSYCARVNEQYMRCKEQHAPAEACVAHAQAVTRCTITMFEQVRQSPCAARLAELSTCLEKTNNYNFTPCQKPKAALAECVAGVASLKPAAADQ